MIRIDGKQTAAIIKEEIAQEVQHYKTQGKRAPHLVAVIVGNDTASQTYVAAKIRACQQVGFNSTSIELPENITEEQLLDEIALLNHDKNVDGYIVQLPLPQTINEEKIIMAIHPDKDVDGFHPVNLGKMLLEIPSLLPATPYGIIELLERYNIETAGKHVVIIGRSHIVGRPLSVLMSQKRTAGNATVSLCHSKTKGLKQLTLQADIVVVALGVPEFLKADMITEDTVVIDVGIHRIADSGKKRGYRLTGDVDFDAVSKKASYITPVPGGVGPMTIAMLLKNTLLAYQKTQNK